MSPVTLLAPPPHWYSILAGVFSVYQAVRGWIYQDHFAHMPMKDGAHLVLNKTPSQRILLRNLADGVFYFVTTLAGFATLVLALRILLSLPSLENVSGGTGAIVIFFFSFGILGITGKLPDLIHQGKFPR